MSKLEALRYLLDRLKRTAGARVADIATGPGDEMRADLVDRLRSADVILRRQNLGDFKAGKLKNVHESRRTASAAGPTRAIQVRSYMEPRVLGGTDVNYGYLTEDPQATFRAPLSTRYPDRGATHLLADTALAEYGQYGLKLRPEARSRTSFTLGDSVDASRGPWDAKDIAEPQIPWHDVASEGSPLKSVAKEFLRAREAAMKADTINWMSLLGKQGWPADFVKLMEQRFGGEGYLMLERQLPRLVARPIEDPGWKPLLGSERAVLSDEKLIDNVLRRGGVGGISNYFEAQVHGGVTPADVSAVYDFNVAGNSALEKQLRKLGVDYVPPPEDNVGALIKKLNIRTYHDLVSKLGSDVLTSLGPRVNLDVGPQHKYDMNTAWRELPPLKGFAHGGSVR